MQLALSYEIPVSLYINADFFSESRNLNDLVEYLSGIEKSKYSLKQLAFEYLTYRLSQVAKLTLSGKIIYNQLVWMRKQSLEMIAYKTSDGE